jgi:hypothetical protein
MYYEKDGKKFYFQMPSKMSFGLDSSDESSSDKPNWFYQNWKWLLIALLVVLISVGVGLYLS